MKYTLTRYKKFLLPFLGLVVLVVTTGSICQFNFHTLIHDFPEGLGFVSNMFPPNWESAGEMGIAAAETVLMAILGTIIGGALSILIGLAAASNISPMFLRNTSRFIISIERALPEIIILLILVSGFGFGMFVGVLALAIGCIGMLGKLIADSVEEIELKTLRAIESTGASKWQIIRFAVLPEIMPSLIANTIFRFEVNIRISVILGAVGAGGIGYKLFHSFSLTEYETATMAILTILLLVFLTERVSDFLRSQILNKDSITLKRLQENYFFPSQKFKRRITFFFSIVVFVVGFSYVMDFQPQLLFSEFHYMLDIINDMLPPDFTVLWKDGSTVFDSILETISMAVLGTIMGGAVALFLAFFAASNTSVSDLVRSLTRGLLAIERVTPSLIIILVFVIAVGIGPFAGLLAIALGTIGMFGKLFADALEHVDENPVNAIYSVGASKLQAIRYGIIPQVIPSFIANFFYAFDVNLRAAIALGVFGGGGIGYELYLAQKYMNYPEVLALTFFTILLITLFEKISDYLRGVIIGEELV